jgi:predicted permease
MMLARLFRVSRHRVRSLAATEQLDRDLNRELAFHLEQLTLENTTDGMTEQGARDAARRAIGNIPLLEEQCRDHRRTGWLRDLRQDALHGLRLLRKNPGFTAVAIASLALGIGANTAVLGVMDRVLLGALPFPNADRLVVVRSVALENPGLLSHSSIPDYLAWKEQAQRFDSIGVSIADRKDFGSGEDGSPPERIQGQAVSPGLFRALGIQPMLGRVFTDAEAENEHPAPVIVISHSLWQRHFASDPRILNQTVRMSGATLTIIGVMPPGFAFPVEAAEYYVPIGINQFQRRGTVRLFQVTARLKDGATIEQAQADLEPVAIELARELPEGYKGWGVRIVPLRDYFLGWAKRPLFMLESAVGLVLLIACANVATLLLARASVRGPEISMRLALGAGRSRIVRQLLTESVLLSLLGGALGVLVAQWGLQGLLAMTPPPGALHIASVGLNPRTLAVAMALSLSAGLLFGAAPAIAFRWNLASSLKKSGAGLHVLRGGLVAAQISLALVLLVGSGLLIHSFVRIMGEDLNFDPTGLLTFEYRISQTYVHNLGSFHGAPYAGIDPTPLPRVQRVFERLRTLPGATAVAGISQPPMNSLVPTRMAVLVEGRPAPETEMDRNALNAGYFFVTPSFFATMKTPLVRGRDFNEHDNESAQWVAIVNETAARRFWPNEDPLGKRFTLDVVAGEQPREVIGVVRDIPIRRLFPVEPVVYTSYLQQSPHYQGPSANMFGQMTFLLRSSANPMSLASVARQAVADADPEVPIASVVTMEQQAGSDTLNRRYYMLVFAVFASAATILAAIGVYGVVAYAVAQRTREIGIRMALGAKARNVVLLVGGRALLMIAAGLAAGLAGSLALARLIRSQLWGVSPTDPTTFAGVSLLLAFVAMVACCAPLRNATKVDPAATLRVE